MKPAPFRYVAPDSLDEALELAAGHEFDAKLLAGGQSLIPAMNFRLAQPALLIDLNRIEGLSYIRQDADTGGLRIGAMTRQRQAEESQLVARQAPLIHQALPYVAHVQIRNRGTMGGSLAHADPAAELPAVLLALQARFRLQSRQGERWVEAQDFFTGLFETALAPEEILTEIEVPPLPSRSGCAFAEFARRHGDYALAGVAAQVTLDEAGACSRCRLVLLSVGEGPVEAKQAQGSLTGHRPQPEVLSQAAQLAACNDIDPQGDIHASVDYRRHLVRVLAERALKQAFERAAG
ncbi:MAG: xanthine dehydrogenase family protein subunit M [Acidobacteriota bacterium]